MSLASVDRSTGSAHFKPLDGLRGIAILLVIVHHAYHHVAHDPVSRALTFISGAGWIGVTLFFSLSGFLIGGILMDAVGKPHWYRGFFARRSLRIFPLYFTFLIVYWFVLARLKWTRYAAPHPVGNDAAVFWVYLANMRELIVGRGVTVPALDPLWSLSVEEQVYVLLPFLIWLCPFNRLGKLLAGVFVSSVIWKLGCAALRAGIEPRYAWLPACIDAFAAGAMIAWMSRHPQWRERVGSIATPVARGAGLFILGIGMGNGGLIFWDNPLLLLSVGTIALAVFFGGWIGVIVSRDESTLMNRMLSARWLRWCGQYSYAAYLFHATIIALLQPHFGVFDHRTGFASLPRAIGFTAAVGVISFMAARLSWELLEKHFIALKRYFPAASHVVRAD
ncbi:MAG: acyltransferase [Phycisphaerae bacterium]|nr:acyltransferase [Phycisphaerae bacterium]